MSARLDSPRGASRRLATHRVLATAGRSPGAREVVTPVSLRTLALRHGTDKEGKHAYTAAYERHLGHLRDEPIRLLEIGIGGHRDPHSGGASLRMWKEFFPRATIVGVDIVDKSALAEDRIVTVQGNQGDAAFLQRLAADHGPFDVVIDDGSHWCSHVITSFRALFPLLSERGIYAIEDLQTSYWETYGGSSGPDRRGTSMAMLTALVDGLNHAEYDIPGYVPSYTDRWVTSVTFYHNLAFVQKGPNTDGSSMLPPHPRSGRHFAKPAPSTRRVSAARRWIRRVVPYPIRRVGVGAVRAARAVLRRRRR